MSGTPRKSPAKSQQRRGTKGAGAFLSGLTPRKRSPRNSGASSPQSPRKGRVPLILYESNKLKLQAHMAVYLEFRPRRKRRRPPRIRVSKYYLYQAKLNLHGLAALILQTAWRSAVARAQTWKLREALTRTGAAYTIQRVVKERILGSRANKLLKSREFKREKSSGGYVWAWGQNLDGQLGVVRPIPSSVPRDERRYCSKCPKPSAKDMAAFEKRDDGGGVHGPRYADTRFNCGHLSFLCTPCTKELVAKKAKCSTCRTPITSFKKADDFGHHVWDTPVIIPMFAKTKSVVVMVACGLNFSAALTSFGDLYMWGNNDHGQLGTGTTQSSMLPVIVSNFEDQVVHVSLGQQHSAAVTERNLCYVWGNGWYGQLGHGKSGRDPESGDPYHELLPRRLDFHGRRKNFRDVTCGWWTTAVADEEGMLYTFGRGKYGILGHGNEKGQSHPRLVEALANRPIRAMSMGVHHMGAVEVSSGNLWMWGWEKNGILGHGDAFSRHKPCLVEALKSEAVEDIKCGQNHTVCLMVNGFVYVWGSNQLGQLGTEQGALSFDGIRRPVKLVGLEDKRITQISVGSNHTSCLSSSGYVFSFGVGVEGQLGHSSLDDSPTPKPIIPLLGTGVIKVVCGSNYTMALTAYKEDRMQRSQGDILTPKVVHHMEHLHHARATKERIDKWRRRAGKKPVQTMSTISSRPSVSGKDTLSTVLESEPTKSRHVTVTDPVIKEAVVPAPPPKNKVTRSRRPVKSGRRVTKKKPVGAAATGGLGPKGGEVNVQNSREHILEELSMQYLFQPASPPREKTPNVIYRNELRHFLSALHTSSNMFTSLEEAARKLKKERAGMTGDGVGPSPSFADAQRSAMGSDWAGNSSAPRLRNASATPSVRPWGGQSITPMGEPEIPGDIGDEAATGDEENVIPQPSNASLHSRSSGGHTRRSYHRLSTPAPAQRISVAFPSWGPQRPSYPKAETERGGSALKFADAIGHTPDISKAIHAPSFMSSGDITSLNRPRTAPDNASSGRSHSHVDRIPKPEYLQAIYAVTGGFKD